MDDSFDFDKMQEEMIAMLTEDTIKELEDMFTNWPSKEGWVSGKVCDWLEVPFDIRRLIIGAMDDDTKMAFLLCSDECVADMPKDYIKRIDFSGNGLMVDAISSDEMYYSLSFQDSNGKCIITPGSGTYWKMEEEGSIAEVSLKYFQRIFNHFTNLEVFESGNQLRLDNMKVNHLSKLKRLTVNQSSPIDLFECGFISFEKFCNLTISVDISCMPLSLSQLKQVKAATISYCYNNVSSKYANDYLKCFVNGEIDANVKEVYLYGPGNRLDIDQITEGLSVFGVEKNDEKVSFSVLSAVNDDLLAVVDIRTSSLDIKIYTTQELEDKKNNPEPIDYTLAEYYGFM